MGDDDDDESGPSSMVVSAADIMNNWCIQCVIMYYKGYSVGSRQCYNLCETRRCNDVDAVLAVGCE